jgi:hypothetical protein
MSAKTKEKELVEKRKALMAELRAERERKNETKNERKEVRSTIAQSRREIGDSKKDLRQTILDCYATIKSGDADAIDALADRVAEAATSYAGYLRTFAAEARKLGELV